MYYEYNLPKNTLFKCLWYSETSVPYQPILADGRADLIFKVENKEISYFLITAQFSTIYAQTDCLSYYYGVRFHPGGLHQITRLPIKSIINQIIDANNFKFSQTLKPYFSFWHKHHNHKLIYQELQKIIVDYDNKNSYAHLLLNYWNKKKIEDIASISGYSLRHFNRKINEEIGCSPYFFYRIMRMNKAIRLKKDQKLNDSDIAFICQYSDQAHMLNDIKSLSGHKFSSW